jgi:hypothetical protein
MADQMSIVGQYTGSALKYGRALPFKKITSDQISCSSAQVLETLLKDEELKMNEYERFRILEQCMEADGDSPSIQRDRHPVAANLVQHILLDKIDPKHVSTSVAASGLVASEKLSEVYKIKLLLWQHNKWHPQYSILTPLGCGPGQLMYIQIMMSPQPKSNWWGLELLLSMGCMRGTKDMVPVAVSNIACMGRTKAFPVFFSFALMNVGGIQSRIVPSMMHYTLVYLTFGIEMMCHLAKDGKLVAISELIHLRNCCTGNQAPRGPRLSLIPPGSTKTT